MTQNNLPLEQVVARAVARMQAEGITGWGLDGDEATCALGGEWARVGSVYGCDSETCAHNSHGSRAANWKWVPPAGSTLSRIGGDGSEDGCHYSYYVLRHSGVDTYLRLRDPKHHHSSLRVVTADEVPDFLLAALVEG